MRKFLIKHFALSHISKIFGRDFRPLRATTPTASSLILLAMFDELQMTIPYYLSFISLIGCIFVGFVYFGYLPIKWYECDKDQKWMFGQNVAYMSESRTEEWREISDEMETELSQKNFRNVFPVILPMILTTITILIYTKVL